jgi:hypothetical protein
MGGTLFRDQRYAAFFSLAGISIALILFTMIYRENIEGWFRGMRLTQHERESGGGQSGSGRGWSAQERAVEGW